MAADDGVEQRGRRREDPVRAPRPQLCATLCPRLLTRCVLIVSLRRSCADLARAQQTQSEDGGRSSPSRTKRGRSASSTATRTSGRLVRLLRSSLFRDDDETDIHRTAGPSRHSFQAHPNAVFDLSWSHDDSVLVRPLFEGTFLRALTLTRCPSRRPRRAATRLSDSGTARRRHAWASSQDILVPSRASRGTLTTLVRLPRAS